MVARTRLVDLPDISGEITTVQNGFTNKLVTSLRDSEWHQCADQVGSYGKENPLRIIHISRRVKPVTGFYASPDGKLSVTTAGHAIPRTFGSGGAGLTTLGFEAIGSSHDVLRTRLLGRSSPSRPIVDLPVFLFELKDLPRMIKQAGDAIHWVRNSARGKAPPTAAGMASANLAYQFGWEPLLSDLWSLFKFQEAFERKRSQLNRLYSGRGLRRNIKLESETIVTSGSGDTHGLGGLSLYSSWTSTAKYKAWGSIRWKPKNPIPGFMRPNELEVLRAALGLDISLATVWEALPWSWLIDWFSTAGDFLAAHRNTVPATPSNICIMQMRERITNYTSTGTNCPGVEWSGATVSWARLERTPHANVTPSISMAFPFLGIGQLSILGSLFILSESKSGKR